MVDKTKTTMDQSLKGRWISVSWHRKSDSFDFFAYDVGFVLEVKMEFVQLITKMMAFISFL